MVHITLANPLALGKLSLRDKLVFIEVVDVKVEIADHHIIVRVADERVRVSHLKSTKKK